MRLNHDGLVNAASKEVANVTFNLLDALQNRPPHIQTAAVAAMFILITEHYRAKPQDVMVAVKNMLARDAEGDGGDGREEWFRAVRLYIKNELNK